MQWPFARLTDYNANNPPAIKSADLNAIQDLNIKLAAQNFGRDYLLYDDFTGSAIDTSKWSQVTAGATPASGGDIANGGYGAVQCAATAGNHNVSVAAYMGQLGTTQDFYLSARARVPTFAVGAADVGFGLQDSGVNAIYFTVLTGGTTWSAAQHNTFTNLGVAFSSAYAFFEIQRTGGVLSFSINGTSLYSISNSDATTGGSLFIFADYSTGNATITVDSIKLWLPR